VEEDELLHMQAQEYDQEYDQADADEYLAQEFNMKEPGEHIRTNTHTHTDN
jgi:hypothetical protein